MSKGFLQSVYNVNAQVCHALGERMGSNIDKCFDRFGHAMEQPLSLKGGFNLVAGLIGASAAGWGFAGNFWLGVPLVASLGLTKLAAKIARKPLVKAQWPEPTV